MLDTIELRQRLVDLDFRRFGGWNKYDKTGMQSRSKSFTANDACTYTITAENNFGDKFLRASVSLPKFINENNVQMLIQADIAPALYKFSNLVSNYADLEFDAANADVTRIDVCHNWTVADVLAYLDAAKYASYPRKYMHEINRDKGVPSVYFGRRHYDEIYLYDKFAETKRQGKAGEPYIEIARNQLRVEHTICKGKVKNVFGDIKAKNVFDEMKCQRIIENDMKNLGLDKPIRGRTERYASLRKHCIGKNGNLNKRKLKSLFSTLSLIDEFESNDKFVLSEVMNESTYYRHKRQLQEAGVWMSTANRQTLPPLGAPQFCEELAILDAQIIDHM